MSKPQRTQVYLPAELRRKARLLGVQRGQSLTSVVREALSYYVEAQEKTNPADVEPLDELAGFVSGGRSAGRTRDDEIYGR